MLCHLTKELIFGDSLTLCTSRHARSIRFKVLCRISTESWRVESFYLRTRQHARIDTYMYIHTSTYTRTHTHTPTHARAVFGNEYARSCGRWDFHGYKFSKFSAMRVYYNKFSSELTVENFCQADCMGGLHTNGTCNGAGGCGVSGRSGLRKRVWSGICRCACICMCTYMHVCVGM